MPKKPLTDAEKEAKTIKFLMDKFDLTEEVSKSLFADVNKALTAFEKVVGKDELMSSIADPFHPAIVFDDFLYITFVLEHQLSVFFKTTNFLSLILGNESILLEIFENGSLQVNDADYEDNKLCKIKMTINNRVYKYSSRKPKVRYFMGYK
jgi:hypothetical protein